MSWTDKISATRNELRGLNKTIPDTARAFGGLSKSVKEGGVLDHKTKEFVALGMAIVSRCEPCISLHCEALVKAGATKDEIADVLGMAIQMGGGPAMMYAGKALACFEELSAG
ncbi:MULTISPECIES: carboxymuconolactone decarboxylase family protein [unclassified Shimia]|uniref:carboxymuconolactone decarboxylase family protein n=1 Tax=unclassified Shimia TaxID=2630038 RepID=UPI001AD95E74|nr:MULTISPECIES: carboxymuconolactone decarboxylase family protein [unclassified Shimia]MBO9472898.1 carboxymuconolactone decarboxylase family protein [Shimia sp. R10_1]MDA5556594.1 carboxymuconolactone decarboxylase family protein [Shimia sp. MMG029]